MGLPADEIVVDLEDSVAADEKARARSELAARMPELTLGGADRRGPGERGGHRMVP
ncbi:hypothetical protein [Actinomadura sp. BRA 177]|uniref:hypothetical protein n=1 Tax=Actinomadura sp. BRA 177 TaxID=2745202 RepID=UPI002816565F|nr:hypothetical protein [Actinomadura sp. BRA 177]